MVKKDDMNGEGAITADKAAAVEEAKADSTGASSEQIKSEAGMAADEKEEEKETQQTPLNSEESVHQPNDGRQKWYVVHTYSGYENKVRTNLLRRIESMKMQEKIFQVLVPTEEEIEFKDGKKKTVQKKLYPGYVLVEMIMTDASWYVVRNTSGVTGFVGSAVNPVPLPDEEVSVILRQMGLEAPVRVNLDIDIGQTIKILRGPFEGFKGVVDEVSVEREKIKVLLTIFGRETPVELEFSQVEKL